jgi:hypothetical protein
MAYALIAFLLKRESVAIDTPGGNLSLKIKSRAQQITLKPNIIKNKNLLKKNLLKLLLFFVKTFIMFGFKVICWALLFIFKLKRERFNLQSYGIMGQLISLRSFSIYIAASMHGTVYGWSIACGV